jgi:hypothetical protein
MKFSDLSAADQRLLQTDLGDFDKVAAQQFEEASDCYNQGFEKFAAEAADAQDEADEMDKKASELEPESLLTPEQEKVAAELGAITEKGFFDGLCKLGSERHGDEMHYLWPFIEQKIAQEGAAVALEKFAGKMDWAKNLGAKAKGAATEAKDRYMNSEVGPRALKEHASRAMSAEKGGTHGERAKHLGKAALIVGGHAGLLGSAGYSYRAGKAVVGKKD